MTNKQQKTHYEWSVAIFTARETVDVLLSTLNAVVEATKFTPSIIDVLVNGNSKLANDMAQKLKDINYSKGNSIVVRIWDISVPDKAFAWNQYVHEIWPNAKVTYFIDGYVQINSDALTAIDRKLRANIDAYAATGVPTHGRSAKSLREELINQGGIHGNLYAIKGEVMKTLRKICFKLPLGIYRTDPTLGAALGFALDPKKYDWDIKRRIITVPEASWKAPTLSMWRIKDLMTQWKRINRQALGILETAAVREHLAINKLSPSSLPSTATELVTTWIKSFPSAARRIYIKKPLSFFAVRQLYKKSKFSGLNHLPVKVYEENL